MAKKRDATTTARNVTADRAGRLYRLVKFLGTGAQSRAAILRRLRINIRGFYRDLEALRAAGIKVELIDGHYALSGDLADALEPLPFPDPGLTFGDAHQLARGKTRAHQKIKERLDQFEG